MSLATRLKPAGSTGFGADSTAEQVSEGLSLEGKTILVTGCTSGLGLETCRVLSLRGADVIGAGRSRPGAEKACSGLPKAGVGMGCDLSDPRSVRGCVARIQSLGFRLDAIICNAGILGTPTLHRTHGYELQFFTNHIGHFMLVLGLFDQLAPDARIVAVSSAYHRFAPREGIRFDNLGGRRGYNAWSAYGQSKLANILFASEFQRRYGASGKTAYSVHPGLIPTNLARRSSSGAKFFLRIIAPLFLKNVQQGAATQLFAAVHPDAVALAGHYLADVNVAKPGRSANDPGLARRLWEFSEELVHEL